MSLIKCNCGNIDKCEGCEACVSNKTEHKPQGHFINCKDIDLEHIEIINIDQYKYQYKVNNEENYQKHVLGKTAKEIEVMKKVIEKQLNDNIKEASELFDKHYLGIFYDDDLKETEPITYDKLLKDYKSSKMKEEEKMSEIGLVECGCWCNHCNMKDQCKECGYCTNENHKFVDGTLNIHNPECSYYTKEETTKMDDKKELPQATFYKLSNGTWAIKSSQELYSGDAVIVTKKSGEKVEEVVEKFNIIKDYWDSSKLEYVTYYIYTIEKKYKKGNGKPIEQTEVSNNKPKKGYHKKVKDEIKYDILVWENKDGDYVLQSEINKLPSSSIVSLLDIYKKQGDKYIVATRYSNKDSLDVHSYTDKIYGDTSLVQQLVVKYINKKEAEENKEKLWIMCKMNCKDFPARSQKIKGIRELSHSVYGMVNHNAINSANVVTYNDDIENVEHKHSSYGYSASGNKRYKIEEIIKNTLNKFMRPCPENPEHGFVDSRLVTTEKDILNVIEEIKKTGEIPEFIVMDKVECDFSGVITPDMINLGRGNAGATEGEDAFFIPIQLSKEDQDKLRKMFWNNEERQCNNTKCLQYNKTQPGVKCSGCEEKLNYKWPFVEVLYESQQLNPTIVQLRSGPCMEIKEEKIKVKYIKEINSDMKLIEWGKLSKEMVDDIENSPNGSYSRICPVVWHPGGAPTSHFGVHCRNTKLPYITSTEKPIEGSIIKIGVKNKLDLESFREGLTLGLETQIKDDGNRYYIKRYLKNFLGALHGYALMDLGNKEVARFVGYSWAVGARIIAALPFGEAVHKHECRETTAKIVGEALGHERDYDKVWRLDLERTLSGLIECYRGFTKLTWSSSYGGPAWAACTLSLIEVFVGIRDFLRTQDSEKLSHLVNKTNEMVNLAHNNGWWLNKLLQKSDFDNASVLPHFFIDPVLAFRLRDEYKGIGKFAMKLKGYNIAKKIRVEDLEKIGAMNYVNVPKIGSIAKAILNNEIVIPASNYNLSEIEVPEIKPKTQVEITKLIDKDSNINAQYVWTLDKLHIQIKSYHINRDYGFSGTYSWTQNSIEQSVVESFKKFYIENNKAGWLVKSFASENMYSKCVIYKSKEEGFVIIHGFGFAYIYDPFLYKEMDKVSKWQIKILGSSKENEKKVLEMVKEYEKANKNIDISYMDNTINKAKYDKDIEEEEDYLKKIYKEAEKEADYINDTEMKALKMDWEDGYEKQYDDLDFDEKFK